MQIGCEGRAVVAVDVDFGSGVRVTAHCIGRAGIKVFLAIEALVATSENIPSQARGNCQTRREMIGILDEGRIVRIGLGREDIFGEVRIEIVFWVWTVRVGRQANEQRSKITSADSTHIGLICSANVKLVRARRRRRLADVEIPFHPLETKRDFVFAVDFGEGGVGITVFAGVAKVIVVGGAANGAIAAARPSQIAEHYEWQLLDDLLRGQRSWENQRWRR